MVRVSKPANNSTILVQDVVGPLIDDYLSLTQTTQQTVASDISLAAGKQVKYNGTALVNATDANISITDVTTNNVSIGKHGFIPKLPNDALKTFNGVGTWAAPLPPMEVFTAGEALDAYELVYIASDGKIYKARADAKATTPAFGMTRAAIALDAQGYVQLFGLITNNFWNWSTKGALLYLSTATAGAITDVQPTPLGNLIQIMGQVVTATQILLLPNTVTTEIGVPDGGSDVNLAPFPNGWVTDYPFGNQIPALNIYHETTETYLGAYTIRIEPTHATNSGCGFWIVPVAVGDVVVIRCWVKTLGDTPADMSGARMGLDWYGVEQRRISAANCLKDAETGDYRLRTWDDENNAYLSWGEDWTLLEWIFRVPSIIVADQTRDIYTQNQLATPAYIWPWVQIWDALSGTPQTGCSTAYFSNFEVLVNPEGVEPTTPPTTYLFEDGFETGDLSEWTTGSGTVQTTNKHHGTYGYLTAANRQFLANGITPIDDVFYGFAVKRLATPASNQIIASLWDNGWSFPVNVIVKTNNVIALQCPSGTYDTDVTMNTSDFYYIVIRRKVGAGNGIASIKINGTMKQEKTTETITGNTFEIDLGSCDWTNYFNGVFDCVKLNATDIGET